MPSAIKCNETERSVNEQGSVKHDQTWIGSPRGKQDRAGGLHRIDRSNAKCVVDQMQCRKREKDQATDMACRSFEVRNATAFHGVTRMKWQPTNTRIYQR